MLFNRALLFVFAAALTACHPEAHPTVGASSVASASKPPAAPATSTASAKRAPASGLCAGILSKNDALLAAPSGHCEGHEADEAAVRASSVAAQKNSFLHFCREGHGTWAVALQAVSLANSSGETGACGWSATYKLVHARDAATALASAPATPVRTWNAFVDESTNVSDVRSFDYDADGSDELLLSGSEDQSGAGTVSTVEVLRDDGHAVVPYPVGFPYDGIVDADADGRPDLLQGAYFHSEKSCGRGTHTINGVPLLLHSLANGTFSRTDDVARRWAVTECPTAGASRAQPESCATGLSCRFLWGQPATSLAHWAGSAPTCKSEECGSADIVRDVAKAALPFKPLNVATPAVFPAVKLITAAPDQD